MTLWELIRIMTRYWPIVLVGAVCTVGCGLLAISSSGVYFTRTTLAFHAPSTVLNPNSFRTQSEDVIDTAGVVAKRVSGPGRVTKFASTDVTLVGLGVRTGWSLRLPDTGGQWATNFATQALILDVVGPSAEAVQRQQEDVIQQVQRELAQLQADAGVKPTNYITVSAAPASTVIFYVNGSRQRALAITAVMGIGLTIAVVLAVDRRGQRSAVVSRVPAGHEHRRRGVEAVEVRSPR
jgi:hypothetical protein